MSTPEERLSALLHDEDVAVSGDGLSRIQARVARRRRRRLVLAPVAALAVVGVVATAVLAVDRDPKSALLPGGSSASPVAPVGSARRAGIRRTGDLAVHHPDRGRRLARRLLGATVRW